MSEYYCRRCDKEGVSGTHRCFTVFSCPPIRPLKKRPHPNTPAAQKLARMYEECYTEPFPGGVENAKIERDYAAAHPAWRDGGPWTWYLEPIGNYQIRPHPFGSQYTVKECLKDKTKIECDPDSHEPAFT